MDIEGIINLNIKKNFFLYYEMNNEFIRSCQIIFNNGDCDLLMKKDKHTYFKLNYEGINHLGEFIFDEIDQSSNSCCSSTSISRNRLLFARVSRDMHAIHIDKISGHRARYILDK